MTPDWEITGRDIASITRNGRKGERATDSGGSDAPVARPRGEGRTPSNACCCPSVQDHRLRDAGAQGSRAPLPHRPVRLFPTVAQSPLIARAQADRVLVQRARGAQERAGLQDVRCRPVIRADAHGG